MYVAVFLQFVDAIKSFCAFRSGVAALSTCSSMSPFGSKILVPFFHFDTCHSCCTACGGMPRVAPSKLNEALQGAPPLVFLCMRRTEDMPPFKTNGYIQTTFMLNMLTSSSLPALCWNVLGTPGSALFFLHRGVHPASLCGVAGYATRGTPREASQGN